MTIDDLNRLHELLAEFLDSYEPLRYEIRRDVRGALEAVQSKLYRQSEHAELSNCEYPDREAEEEPWWMDSAKAGAKDG